MIVPCGKCVNCFQNRRASWTIRMLEELKDARTSKFVTITYNDNTIPLIEVDGKIYKTLDKEAIRAYLKRLKIKVDRWYDSRGDDSLEKALRRPVKYFLVGEYGPKTFRPHYHVIFYNLPKNFNKWLLDAWYVKSGDNKIAAGFVHVGEVTQASIHYTTKYILDGLLTTGNFSSLKNSKGEWIVEKPFNLISNGIGADYVKKMANYHNRTENSFYTFQGGKRKALPRYYKDKIFNEYQKINFAEEAEKEQWKKDDEERKRGIEKYVEYEGKKVNVMKFSKMRKI